MHTQCTDTNFVATVTLIVGGRYSQAITDFTPSSYVLACLTETQIILQPVLLYEQELSLYRRSLYAL